MTRWVDECFIVPCRAVPCRGVRCRAVPCRVSWRGVVSIMPVMLLRLLRSICALAGLSLTKTGQGSRVTSKKRQHRPVGAGKRSCVPKALLRGVAWVGYVPRREPLSSCSVSSIPSAPVALGTPRARHVGTTKPPGAAPGGSGAGDGNRTRL